MKKGLSKILSLACVFALLLTMALPAFAVAPPVSAGEAAELTKVYTKGVSGVQVIGTVTGADASAYYTPIQLKAEGSETVLYGVFVKENDTARFRTIKTVDGDTTYSVKTTNYTADEKFEWVAGTPTQSEPSDTPIADVEATFDPETSAAPTSASDTKTKKTGGTVKNSENKYVATVTEYTARSAGFEWKAGAPTTADTTTQPTAAELAFDPATATKPENGAATATKKEILSSTTAKIFETKDGYYVFQSPLKGVYSIVADAGKYYIFNSNNGDMIYGDDQGKYSDKDANKNNRLWSIADTGRDPSTTTRKAYVVTNPDAFKATISTVSNADNAAVRVEKNVIEVVGNDGKWAPVSGKVYYHIDGEGNITAKNKTEYDALGDKTGWEVGYQKDGKAVGGIVEIPPKKDPNGNTIAGGAELYEFVDGNPISKQVTTAITGADATGTVVKAKTTYDAKSKKAGSEKSYLAVSGKLVLKGDSDGKNGNYPIKTIGKGESQKRYILNEDGTLRTNSVYKDEVKNAPVLYSTAAVGSKNIRKVGEKEVDSYETVEVVINGVTQRYCLDETGKILQKGYRRLVGNLGVSYYTDDGITYKGWVEGGKYQTEVEGNYIIVTGLQTLPEGKDPVDTEKTIEAGWYLFDNEGTQIKDSYYETNDHKYELKDGKVVTIDGEAPTPADINKL